jgi:hypothetical protein
MFNNIGFAAAAGSLFLALLVVLVMVLTGGREEEDPGEVSLSRLLAEENAEIIYGYDQESGAVSVAVQSEEFRAVRSRSGGESSFLGLFTGSSGGGGADGSSQIGKVVGTGYMIIGTVTRRAEECGGASASEPACRRIAGAMKRVQKAFTGYAGMEFRGVRVYEDDAGDVYTCGFYRIFRENRFIADSKSVERPFITPSFSTLPAIGGLFIHTGSHNHVEWTRDEEVAAGHPCFSGA